jgi:hypothetical protein
MEESRLKRRPKNYGHWSTARKDEFRALAALHSCATVAGRMGITISSARGMAEALGIEFSDGGLITARIRQTMTPWERVL